MPINLEILFRNGYMGVRLTDGTLLFEPVYDIIRPFKGDVAWASRGGKWGVLARDGRTVLRMMIDAEPQFVRGQTTWVSMSGKWGIVRSDGQMLLGAMLSNRPDFGDGDVAWGFWAGHWGVISYDGNVVLEPILDTEPQFDKADSCWASWNGRWGVVDRNGAVVIPAMLPERPVFDANGYAWIEIDGRWGLTTAAGEMRLQPQFDLKPEFSNLLSWVRSSDRWGVVAADGQMLIPTVLAEEGSGRRVVGNAVIDISQNTIEQYDNIEAATGSAGETYYKFTLKGKTGVMNSECSVVIEPLWDDVVYNAASPLHPVRSGDKWGFVSAAGRLTVECRYGQTAHFTDALTAVTLGGKWGLIDNGGVERAICKYDFIDRLSGGMARVVNNGRYCFMAEDVSDTVACRYENALPMSEGLAAIKLQGRWGFLFGGPRSESLHLWRGVPVLRRAGCVRTKAASGVYMTVRARWSSATVFEPVPRSLKGGFRRPYAKWGAILYRPPRKLFVRQFRTRGRERLPKLFDCGL